MKVIETVFLAESVTTRANNLVMINNAKNEADRKKMSPFAKLGRVAGQSIRGWIRHAMEKLLIQQGVSVCHRNKDFLRKVLLGQFGFGEFMVHNWNNSLEVSAA